MKKFYHYPNFQNARTLWYHDHGLHYTAENAYSGSGGAVPPARRAGAGLLPQGEFDVAVTLSDMMFAANGSQALRRPDPLRPVGRRHPGQRPARGR